MTTTIQALAPLHAGTRLSVTRLSVTLLALMLLVSCNVLMPGGNYTTPLQSADMTFVYANTLTQENFDSGSVSIRDGVLDTSAGGMQAYIRLESEEYANKPLQFLYIGDRIMAIRYLSDFKMSDADLLNDGGPGFIAYGLKSGDVTRQLYRITYPVLSLDNSLYSGQYGLPLSVPTLHTTESLVGLTWDYDPLSALNRFQGLFARGDSLTLADYSNPNPGTIVSERFVQGAVATAAAAFTATTSGSVPDPFFNENKLEYPDSGYNIAERYSWFVASRRDSLTQEKTQFLFTIDTASALMLPGNVPIAEQVEGAAGSYILVRTKENPPVHQFVLYDKTLTEVETFRVYGRDVVYLGETVLDGVNSMVFATLELGPSANSKTGITVYASLFSKALP